MTVEKHEGFWALIKHGLAEEQSSYIVQYLIVVIEEALLSFHELHKGMSAAHSDIPGKATLLMRRGFLSASYPDHDCSRFISMQLYIINHEAETALGSAILGIIKSERKSECRRVAAAAVAAATATVGTGVCQQRYAQQEYTRMLH